MSKKIAIAALLLWVVACIDPAFPAGAPATTAAGIPLDAAWKVSAM
jgi:hypothetical protein